MNDDWTEESYSRRCANGTWLGCVMLVIVMALGVIIGWMAYHWVVICP